jgi:kumamolisin
MSESPEAGQPPEGYVRLKGSERTPRPSFNAVGPADSNEDVRVVIKVRPKSELPDPAELGAVRPSERPAPEAVEDHTEKYGADQADIDAVKEWAEQQPGIQVEEADASTRLVVLSGTVGSVSAAFETSLKRFESPQGASYRGRVGHVHVPTPLENVITVVTGLDNRPQAKPRQLTAQQHGLRRYTPPQLAQIYSFPEALDGTGQCIGLLEFGGGYDEADLDYYFNDMKVNRPAVTAVSVDGTTKNEPGSDADYEVVLDIEVAGAAAPGASIAVYFGQFTEAGWVEALTKAIHDTENNPSVISISWGYPEFEGDQTFAWTAQVMDEVNTVLKEAANLGITVILAAGDDGSIDGIQDGKVHVYFPACSPYVLGCGGTTLHARKHKRTSEVVWSHGIRADGPGHGATGGGVSEHFPLPLWQANSAAQVPPSASSGFHGRGVPDVAAVADGRTGYAQYINGEMITDGGTSASAPLWAALIARINQSLAAGGGGKRVGYWNPLLYASVGTTAAFHDITVGTNDAHGDLGGAYTAGAGWDACTGWGVPDGTALLNEL